MSKYANKWLLELAHMVYETGLHNSHVSDYYKQMTFWTLVIKGNNTGVINCNCA